MSTWYQEREGVRLPVLDHPEKWTHVSDGFGKMTSVGRFETYEEAERYRVNLGTGYLLPPRKKPKAEDSAG